MKRLGMLFVVVAIGACSDSNAPNVVVDAPIDAAPACSLIGSFKSFDLDGDAGGAQIDVLTFKSNGFFEIDQYRGGMESGPYTTSGNMVTLTDQLADPPTLACGSQGGDPMTDSWTFTFRDACQTLAFEPVGTVCLAHRAVLKAVDGWTLTRE